MELMRPLHPTMRGAFAWGSRGGAETRKYRVQARRPFHRCRALTFPLAIAGRRMARPLSASASLRAYRLTPRGGAAFTGDIVLAVGAGA